MNVLSRWCLGLLLCASICAAAETRAPTALPPGPFLKEWRTHASGTTDAKGQLSLRGFQGDYGVSVSQGGHAAESTFTLAPQAETAEVSVTLT